MARKPRIAIYGVGQYGQYIARFATEKNWPIAAAYNRAGSKVGQDIGRLAGLGRDLGVVVQDCETADYGSLDADIGIVTMTNFLRENMPAYQRLMNAGANVLCHGTQSYFPWGTDLEAAREIDALAKKNRVTFTGSGIWDMSRIWSGMTLAGPCTKISSLFHRSVTNAAAQASGKAQVLQLGAGLTVEEFEAKGFHRNPIASSYKTIPEQVLFGLGYTIADTRVSVEPVINPKALESEFWGGVLPAGHCLGWRTVAEIDTVEGVTARAETEVRMTHPDEIEHTYWAIEGMPRNRSTIERLDSGHATIACLFNRIPDVINAPPGLIVLSLLGPLKPSALL